jgi:methyltransferase (TIGR00027 family)
VSPWGNNVSEIGHAFVAHPLHTGVHALESTWDAGDPSTERVGAGAAGQWDGGTSAGRSVVAQGPPAERRAAVVSAGTRLRLFAAGVRVRGPSTTEAWRERGDNSRPAELSALPTALNWPGLILPTWSYERARTGSRWLDVASAAVGREPVGESRGTARWIAAARAREISRPDRLFDDPWAAELAGPDGFAMLTAREPDGKANAYLPIRTRFFDDLITRHCDWADQIVLLGAGHDTRALRLPLPAHGTVFALDQPDVLDATTQVISRVRADHSSGPAWVPVAVDLRAPWHDHLLGSGFDPASPTLWIAEGLLYYLTHDQVDDLLTTAARLSHTRATFAADTFGTGLLDLPAMRGYVESRRRSGMHPPFCTDDPTGLLHRTGWSLDRIVEPGQDSANFGRLPALPDPWHGGHNPRLRTYLIIGYVN